MPVLLMVIGSIVFVIAFLGCCGAIKESSCMVLSVSSGYLLIVHFRITHFFAHVV